MDLSKVKIVADSSSDILGLDKIPFNSAPLKIIAGDREFVDDKDLNTKEMVDYLYQHENRMSLDAFALSYDSTNGNLSGSMTLNMYYVTGTDKEYVPQNINGISLGTDNIFGTLK